ncbi:unnamed protein product [Lepeophtheirus salmonis]|uniref:(salmon louse) hypothetical protein n=1 Tax=Lepeophtheirus salmonis TaxID=72036 RepID=A0A7R8H026_LEPSM|nr:unnamed protein product [Lepeophtheirus salmonis]CAF2776467.1 unnamed protein product [Lepeophtheirus salmonis]
MVWRRSSEEGGGPQEDDEDGLLKGLQEPFSMCLSNVFLLLKDFFAVLTGYGNPFEFPTTNITTITPNTFHFSDEDSELKPVSRQRSHFKSLGSRFTPRLHADVDAT